MDRVLQEHHRMNVSHWRQIVQFESWREARTLCIYCWCEQEDLIVGGKVRRQINPVRGRLASAVVQNYVIIFNVVSPANEHSMLALAILVETVNIKFLLQLLYLFI